MTATIPSQRLRAAGRTALRLVAIAAVAWGSMQALAWVKTASDAMPGAGGPLVYVVIIGLALVLYAVLLALPYVPGVEIGIMILAMQGPGAALPVYLATVAGLLASFLAGTHLPESWLASALRDAGLGRAAAALAQIEPLNGEQRLALLQARLPGRTGRVLARWRYPLLAALLNLPGNWVLGGGGGIMLIAGLSALFRPWTTAAAVAIAVAPVPLLVWYFGLKLG